MRHNRWMLPCGLLFLAVLFLAACQKQSDSAKHVQLPVQIEQRLDIKTAMFGFWEVIDGSTATIPLTMALCETFGCGDLPRHNTTPDAYNNLISGKVDLLFVTYPSEGELAKARISGIEMEIIPIVKDALVFLVNVENPVDNLSLSQIRDIYTGKIARWNALGGMDEAIMPYQRSVNSGSQTLFLKLAMNGVRPMAPPFEYVRGGMMELVKAVSSYDNAKNAIGYSVFYYTNNMYGNSQFKLLGIDGVKPTRDSIARGTYPLGDHYYAVIRKGTPADSPLRQLISWLLTTEGQTVAARAGYVPIRPLGIWPDTVTDPIYSGDAENSSGTGGVIQKGPEAAEELLTNGVRKPMSDVFYDGYNYIQYINQRIMNELNKNRRDGHLLRPFTGIPKDYPHYEVSDRGNLIIHFPDGNPFFSRSMIIRVELTPDISPYASRNPKNSGVKPMQP